MEERPKTAMEIMRVLDKGPSIGNILKQARNDAFEEAARRIEGTWYIDQDVLPREICQFIRELKD